VHPSGTKALSPGYSLVPAVTLSNPAETWVEEDRVAALRAYDVLYSPPNPDFDDVVMLAARICDVPTALISLVDSDLQWFVAKVGLDACETGREASFCDHAMRHVEVMEVPDATLDPRFADNPLVTGDRGIRFYAGAPLINAAGFPLGALCVIDYRPRPGGLTDLQRQTLTVLARQVISQLELGRAAALSRVADAQLVDRTVQLAESEARFRAIADSMPQMVWSALPDGYHDYFNARWYEFTGMPNDGVYGVTWDGLVHPEDQDRCLALWRHCLATGDAYEVEYRLRRYDGIYRWALGRARPLRDEAGRISRWFGTSTDIDDLKRLEQGKEILSQELSHRIKNIFAVVSALVALSARQFPEAKGFASALRERISALACAHEFVRPHSDRSRPTVGTMTLHAFLRALFEPYGSRGSAGRVTVTGDDARFDDQAATSVALLFHELATNAAKYGALSSSGGTVTLTTALIDDRFVLTWVEREGPLIAGPPDRQGFGSVLATVSVEAQLGGRLERIWAPEGLIVVADLPATALSRRKAAENVY
jgi:PAS domain S-box-containing protein